MFTATVTIWDCFVVGYGCQGPEHKYVMAKATAMSRSPKKAVNVAKRRAWQAFDQKAPRSYHNNVGEPPRVVLSKDGVAIYDGLFS